jgi:hypothetical protein
LQFKASLGEIVLENLSQKYPTQKMTGGVAQAVECLPSKHKALSSNPTTIKGGKKMLPQDDENGWSSGNVESNFVPHVEWMQDLKLKLLF